MAPAKTKARLIAEELCEKFPEASSLGIARRLRKEHPLHFASIELARNAVRIVRGAFGKQHASQAKHPRPKGKAGALPPMPPSFAAEFTPFKMDGCKRIGVISDLHIPYHSKDALSAAVKRLRELKVDGILINGDYADFYQCSTFDRDPERKGLDVEIDLCKDGLAYLRGQFKKCRIVWKAGNHDERWDKFIWRRAPELFNVSACRLPKLMELEKHGVEFVTDKRPVMLGKLLALHGHELTKGMIAPVNPALGAFLKTNSTLIVGHSHRLSMHPEKNAVTGKIIMTWSTGCLCDLRPEYDRYGKALHGFAVVDVGTGGDFEVHNHLIFEDWKVRTA